MKAAQILDKISNRKPAMMGYDAFKKSAILLPLLDIDGETHILFEVRSMSLRSQPGDICLPGGRMDQTDESAQYCAIRETTEELGISWLDIENLQPLDYIVSDFGRVIYPFAGVIKHPERIAPNPSEVGETFTVPLQFFLNNEPLKHLVKLQALPEEDFPYDLIVGGKDYNWQVRHIEELFYQYEDRTIWGLTAKILHHFVTLVK
ncbi:NUDIX hydrolase [Virgibacillus halophilus]|uniref:CoA pyrophosphatase n=1 Tax=Tigheibacillus halophilus TaxID=361280 RepID=A0ABU5C7M6_9BACI|nr:CoA pyrophosphatase [Virgibacillus halophilus]